MADTCPEMLWLLDCLRRACQQQPGCQAGEDLDGDRLLALANWHGVTSLVYWHLRESSAPVALALQAALAEQFQATLRRNFLLAAALVKVLEALAAAGVTAIAFKGPALALQLYRNLGLRQSSDLDILVLAEAVPAAQAVLAAQGYAPVEPLTPPQETLRRQADYERAWFHPDSGVTVDLHWGLAPPYLTGPIAIAELLARSQYLTQAGLSLPVPAPEELLFVLCLNGSKDGWLYLQRLCDVATCLRVYPALDWARLLDWMERAASWRLVGLGLHLAATVLAAPLPERVARRLAADRRLRRLGGAIAQRLARNADAGLTLVERAYFPWQLQDTWQRRWAYSTGLVLPLNERDLAFAQRLGLGSLPPSLYGLYYPLRGLRLLFNHGCGWKT